jgi:hypothetical protein
MHLSQKKKLFSYRVDNINMQRKKRAKRQVF